MPAVRIVTEDEISSATVTTAHTSGMKVWAYIGATMALLAMIGTWLVWFSVFLQRNLQEEDIRSACRRAMPETADRCFDTVVIQRGGIRR
ncbi:MAG: hypothetical protein A4E19_13555 [Nitrospira sp. SG-bin1]|nr:MAG: hypothetical protein A4E19_13555 [Nitrospira sp. SG-bin1]